MVHSIVKRSKEGEIAMKIQISPEQTLTIDHWPDQFPELLHYHIDHFGYQTDYQKLNQLVANNADLTIWKRWMAYLIINCRLMVKAAFRTNHKMALYHLTEFLTSIVESPPKKNVSVNSVINQKLIWFENYYYSEVDPDFIHQQGQSNFRDDHIDNSTTKKLQQLPVSLQQPAIGRHLLSQLTKQSKRNRVDQNYLQHVYPKYQQLGSYLTDHKHRDLTKKILSQQYKYLHDHTLVVDPCKLNHYLERTQVINDPDPYRYHDDLQSLHQNIDDLLNLPAISKQEAEVLKLHTYTNHPLNLDTIGAKFQLSRERIRQIEALALRKLRYDIRQIYWTPDRTAKYYYTVDYHRWNTQENDIFTYYKSFITDERQFDDRQLYLYGTWLTDNGDNES